MATRFGNWPNEKKVWWGYTAGVALLIACLVPVADYLGEEPDIPYLYYLAPALYVGAIGWIGERTYIYNPMNDTVKLITVAVLVVSSPLIFWLSGITQDTGFEFFGEAYVLGDVILSLLVAHAAFVLPPFLLMILFAGIDGG